MNVVFDDTLIELKGLIKSKYCKVRVLNDMIQILKDNNYIFSVGKTNKAKKAKGQYTALTTEKIKSFSYCFGGKIVNYEMNRVEETLGSDTLKKLQEICTNKTEKIIFCSEDKVSELTSLYGDKDNLTFLTFPLFKKPIESVFCSEEKDVDKTNNSDNIQTINDICFGQTIYCYIESTDSYELVIAFKKF